MDTAGEPEKCSLELAGYDGFGDVYLESGVESAIPVFSASMCGQGNRGKKTSVPGFAFSELLHQLVAIDGRHLDVRNKNVWRPLVHQ